VSAACAVPAVVRARPSVSWLAGLRQPVVAVG